MNDMDALDPTPEPAIDHDTVREGGLIELYDTGRLTPDEEAAFEAHLVACEGCQDELELHRSFARGVRAMAAEDVGRAVRTAAPLAILAWLARRSRAFQGGVLALLAVVVVGALALPLLKPAPAGSGGAAVETGTPLFLLGAYRAEGGEPAAEIGAAQAERPLILAVDAGPDARFTSYRMTVTGPDGAELFRQDGLAPNALEVVMATFPAGFFGAGDHRLVLDGLLPDGRAERVAERAFRVR